MDSVALVVGYITLGLVGIVVVCGLFVAIGQKTFDFFATDSKFEKDYMDFQTRLIRELDNVYEKKKVGKKK